MASTHSVSGGPGSTPASSGAGVTAPSMERCSPGGPGSTPAAFGADVDGAGVTAPSRRRPAHPPVVDTFNRAILVFLTICTKDKDPVLANQQMHTWLRSAWEQSGHWSVGRYVVMPDHIHLFCAPGTHPPTSLKTWVSYWKGTVARAAKGHGLLVGGPGSTSAALGAGVTAPSTWPDPLWQQDYWDTQLRRGENYSEKWEYVRHNPVRAGLCDKPEVWQFQGEMNVLLWHD
jgi:putative transposase